MADDPRPASTPDAVPAWLTELRDRMKPEVADLLEPDGRLTYDPAAPDAAEKGARILKAFGRAAVDQLAEALSRGLAARRAAGEDAAGAAAASATAEGEPGEPDSDPGRELADLLEGLIADLGRRTREDHGAHTAHAPGRKPGGRTRKRRAR
ncbi:MAG: hypothetical protein FJ087_22965 [Deltaproteobacteria bacterium]|nr:hypothetical protein [Deltaproteobacteria bacterium]